MLKIADFGFSYGYDPKTVNDDTEIFTTYLGSPLFMAPEVLLQKPYTLKTDIYSLGVLFYFMLQGDFPFYYKNPQAKSDEALAKAIETSPLKFSEAIYISDYTKDLISKMLTFDPKKRIFFRELYVHPAITRILNPTALISGVRNGVQNEIFKNSQ